LVPYLVGGDVTHLQYADATVVLVQNSRKSILNLELILYCFESMSGMRVNYHKSEVYVIGADRAMTYLEIPIHIKKLRKQDLRVVNDKMSKRTHPWQGKCYRQEGN
jgi:hypothetical protein